jgi:DNA-binding MarR family transcriptional regulator
MENKYHTAAGARFAELTDELLRLRGRLMTATRDLSAERGLQSQSQSLILSAVVRAPEPPTVARIARSLGLARQSVQRSANELALSGYIRFEDNPHHKRARQLVATRAGLDIYSHSTDARGHWADQVGSAIGEQELAQAGDTLRRIRLLLEQRERDLPATRA